MAPSATPAPGSPGTGRKTGSTALLDRVSVLAESLLGRVLVVLMGLMVVDVSWQVASRFVFRSPSSFTEELAGFLLIWIGLLGAAYGFRTRAHLGIDLLPARLEERWRRRVEATAHLLVLLFALTTMVGGGIRLVFLAFRLDQTSAAMGWRMGFVYLGLPISGALVVLFSLQSIVAAATGRGGGRSAAEAGAPTAVGPGRSGI